MPFLEALGILKSYTVGGRSLVVLRDLELTVTSGEMVAIVGAALTSFTVTVIVSKSFETGEPLSVTRTVIG